MESLLIFTYTPLCYPLYILFFPCKICHTVNTQKNIVIDFQNEAGIARKIIKVEDIPGLRNISHCYPFSTLVILFAEFTFLYFYFSSFVILFSNKIKTFI